MRFARCSGVALLSCPCLLCHSPTSGDCLGEKTADCVVDCDGGGVTIDKLSSDGLSISLHNGGIAFGGDCNTTTGTWLRPGADYKVFHLEPDTEEPWKTLEKKQLGGWDDEQFAST